MAGLFLQNPVEYRTENVQMQSSGSIKGITGRKEHTKVNGVYFERYYVKKDTVQSVRYTANNLAEIYCLGATNQGCPGFVWLASLSPTV